MPWRRLAMAEDKLTFDQWFGGLNLVDRPVDLAPNELSVLENWEISEKGKLVTRDGATRYSDDDASRPQETPQSITSLTQDGAGTATATKVAHGYAEGDLVGIFGATQTEYNGWFFISNVTANTFDYTVDAAAVYPATGTITAAKSIPIKTLHRHPYVITSSGVRTAKFLASAGTGMYLVDTGGVFTAIAARASGFFSGYQALTGSNFTSGQVFDFARRFAQLFMVNGKDPIAMYDPDPASGAADLQEIADADAPQAAVAINFFEDRMFAFEGITLSYSSRGDPTAWDAADQINVYSKRGGEGRAIVSRKDHQVLFMEDSIWALWGSSKESFQLVNISETIGAISAQGIVKLPDGTILFQSQTGEYALVNMEVRRVSRKVTPVYAITLTETSMCYDPLGERTFATVGVYGAIVHCHRGTPVLDPITGDLEIGPYGWHVFGGGVPSCWCVWDAAIDNNEVFFAAGNGIFQLHGDYDEDQDGNVVEVQHTADMPALDPSGPNAMSRLRWLHVTHIGADDLVVTVRRDFGVSSLVMTLAGASSGGAVWGGFQWADGTTWGSQTNPAARRGSALELQYAHRFAFRVQTTGIDSHQLDLFEATFKTREREVFV